MNHIDILVLAIGLAMDCFAVSVCAGLAMSRIRWRPILTTAFFFGFFQGLMPALGWLLSFSFNRYIEAYDHWIAFGLLAFLGIRMIREEFQKEESPECHSLHIEKPKTLLVLAVATSIDALAVGISFACVGYRDLPSVLPPALVIAIVSFLLSIAGFLGGILFGRRFNPRAGLVGGVILVAIGAKVLGEHLGLL